MSPRYVIAEIGSVHDGSFGNACHLIKLAKSCGANVVKFQTHISSAETLRNAPSPSYFSGESRYDYFNRTSFSLVQWSELLKYAQNEGIIFTSSPFSLEALDLLNSIDCPIIKIPSGEVTNSPLLTEVSKLGKPVLLSSGMSSWAELDTAISLLIDHVDLTVMQCTSAYPCPPTDVGLNVLAELRHRYGTSINLGFSDHTSGIAAGIAAATLGATAIEKHLTFSKSMYGSDASNALEPQQFSLYAQSIHETWSMLDSPVNKDDISQFTGMKKVFEKSIVSNSPLNAGTVICRSHLAFKKPGDGISAASCDKVIGLKTKFDLPKDHQFSFSDFE